MKNTVAERAILAGLVNYGHRAWAELSDIIKIHLFELEINQVIFKCLQRILGGDDPPEKLDLPTILSTAQSLGLYEIFTRPDEVKHLRAIINYPVELTSLRKLALKLFRLNFRDYLKQELVFGQKDLDGLTGEEPISQIINIIETRIVNSALSINENDKPIRIGTDLRSFTEHIFTYPSSNLGLSSGFRIWDQAIGGLRPKTVTLVGARKAVGKSTLGLNISLNVTKNLNVPSLYLDTEMSIDDQRFRILANISSLPINLIQSGQLNNEQKTTLFEKIHEIENLKFQYQNVAGSEMNEILSVARRWIIREVGLNKPCLIIFDYIKLLSTSGLKDLKEFQLLGYMMNDLVNFASKYNVAILAFTQLNRDGITREDTDVISGSDRLLWTASSFSIFKKKSPEEIAEDPQGGNRKMIPIVTRYAQDWEDGDYVNFQMSGEFAQLRELHTRNQRFQQSEQI